jgi:hypothetical protein
MAPMRLLFDILQRERAVGKNGQGLVFSGQWQGKAGPGKNGQAAAMQTGSRPRRNGDRINRMGCRLKTAITKR